MSKAAANASTRISSSLSEENSLLLSSSTRWPCLKTWCPSSWAHVKERLGNGRWFDRMNCWVTVLFTDCVQSFHAVSIKRTVTPIAIQMSKTFTGWNIVYLRCILTLSASRIAFWKATILECYLGMIFRTSMSFRRSSGFSLFSSRAANFSSSESSSSKSHDVATWYRLANWIISSAAHFSLTGLNFRDGGPLKAKLLCGLLLWKTGQNARVFQSCRYFFAVRIGVITFHCPVG